MADTYQTGGPAFPSGRAVEDWGGDGFLDARHEGMTLRDYFAAKALSVVWQDAPNDAAAAMAAYAVADAMLRERRRG